MISRTPKIHQGEVKFVCVVVYAGATSEYLLEFGHGSDFTVEHDEPARLHIDTRGQQPRGSDQHGVSGFRVDEVAQFRLPFGVVAGDAHHVAVVSVHQVSVLVDERLPHACGVFLVDAEDDRLLEEVAAFLQEFRHLSGDDVGPAVQHQVTVEIFGVVDAVFNFFSAPVALAFFRPVPFHVPVDMDFDDFVGGEEAVPDSLFQGVGVDRLIEVMDVGNVPSFLGRGGEADLRSCGEVFQDFPPSRVVGGTATVTLIDHDEVEEGG